MNFICNELNTAYFLELFVTDLSGSPVTGLSPTYVIYKSSDNSVVDSGSFIDEGNGVYHASYTFSALGQYYIIYSTPVNYTDEIENIMVIDRYAREDDLLRALGLTDENKKILDTEHNSDGQLTHAIIELYPSAIDFDNNTNVMATYEYNATYNGSGLMLTMGIKRTA